MFPTKHRAQPWKSLQCLVRECPNTWVLLTGRSQIRTEVKDYFPVEANMAAIEPTPDDIERYIEERLKEDIEMSAMNERLRADIRIVVPKNISGMCVLIEDVEIHRRANIFP